MELSIVILVVGILVLGVTKGSSIITKSRVGSAQSLTKGSPANSIADMIAWYETSLNTSFSTGTAYNNTTVAKWMDSSPRGGNTATSATGPTYIDGALNSLPALRFNGTTQYMTFDASALNSNDYTIFVVEQRRATPGGYFLGFGATAATNAFGYTASTTVAASGPLSSSMTVVTFSASSIVPRILTFYSNSYTQKQYTFINGSNIGGVNGSASTKMSLSSTVGNIGVDIAAGTFYTGDIAEIIVYCRALTINERNYIQTYLGNKYSLTKNLTTSTY